MRLQFQERSELEIGKSNLPVPEGTFGRANPAPAGSVGLKCEVGPQFQERSELQIGMTCITKTNEKALEF